MAALSNIWTKVTAFTYVDVNTTKLTLTDIGVSLTGDKFEVTGAGGTDGEMYEGLQLTATRVDDNNVNIDWAEHSLTAPANDWDFGGMVRVYQTPTANDYSMRITLKNPNAIDVLTVNNATGTTGGVGILSSNREDKSQYGAIQGNIEAAMNGTPLIDAVHLLDITCSIGTRIRIRGAGAVSNVDVVYPAIQPRYTSDEAPKTGYYNVNTEGHNLDELVPHFISYPPPMLPSSVEINIIGSTDAYYISELILGTYYVPQQACNFSYGESVVNTIDADLIRRGSSIQRNYRGISTVSKFQMDYMDAYDRTYIDLMINSRSTIVVDAYPTERSKRWETLTAGYVSKSIAVAQNRAGSSIDISIIDSKLKPGI